MDALSTTAALDSLPEKDYNKRIRAWMMYDWANSAFSTTIMAAVLPVYYSAVAGATLASEAKATQYWSIGLSLSVFIIALSSPILGTISDIKRGKKKFLSFFILLGVIGTGLLVLVDTGDWLMASIFFVLARVGNGGANVFYDALLPHVAKEKDQDRVSSQGYALGYLGGGLLLAINVVMIQLMPGTWGARYSFLTVAVWWAVFSIPILRNVPEPQAATKKLAKGESLMSASFSRLRKTLGEIRQYPDLFKYLISYLIYSDGINTIIGIAAIYGAELGFGTIELILALLLVQFAGIPFSLIFGNLPNPEEKRRSMYLAFVLFNVVMLPLLGIGGSRLIAQEVTGTPSEPFVTTDTAVGEGNYFVDSITITTTGDWEIVPISAVERGASSDEDVAYAFTEEIGASADFAFNGQKVELTYQLGPNHSIWAIWMDGEALLEDGEPVQIDGYNPTVRYDVTQSFAAENEGEHVLSIVNTGEQNPESGGTVMALSQIEVLPPLRTSNLVMILGMLLAIEVIGLIFAFLLGKPLFNGLAATFDTKRTIMFSLAVYTCDCYMGVFPQLGD